MKMAPTGQARAQVPQLVQLGRNSIQTSCNVSAFSGQAPTQAPQCMQKARSMAGFFVMVVPRAENHWQAFIFFVVFTTTR